LTDLSYVCFIASIFNPIEKREKSEGITTGKQKGKMPMATVRSSRVYFNFILKILH